MCHSTPKNLKDLLLPFNIECEDCSITGLSLDSRSIQNGMAFLACKGEQSDGRDFISQALTQGASAVIQQTEQPELHGETTWLDGKPVVSFYDLPQTLSSLGDVFFHHPSEAISLVGVTGTNGKSTVTHLVAQLANLVGQQGGVIGTLGAGLLSDLKQTSNTTPDAITTQSSLAELAHKGAQWVAMEVSSHGLIQKRVASVNMKVAVFTNLTRDHLDYHQTMSAYAEAKRQLLNQPGLTAAVLNGDDPEHCHWLAELPLQIEPIIYGLNRTSLPPNVTHFCFADDIQVLSSGFKFKLVTSWGSEDVYLPLLGEFNIANTLAALGALLSQGVTFASLITCIPKLKNVPGRMELFVSQTQNKHIIVDYAHTPDGLEQALYACRRHCHGRLWCVFGCGGDRDKGKRPIMGRLAERLADHVVITNDNPRSEDADTIANDVLAGVENPDRVQVILDRREAIGCALARSNPDDIILVAGKGHETVQLINNKKIKYDERGFIQRLIEGNGQ